MDGCRATALKRRVRSRDNQSKDQHIIINGQSYPRAAAGCTGFVGSREAALRGACSEFREPAGLAVSEHAASLRVCLRPSIRAPDPISDLPILRSSEPSVCPCAMAFGST